MRTRGRLVLSFVTLYVVLAIGAGVVAWMALRSGLERNAERRALEAASVLDARGFTLNETTRVRMEQLLGFEFEIVENGHKTVDGTIQAQVGQVAVRIDYQTPEYHQALESVFRGTVAIVIVGSALFTALAWWIAARIIRPMEFLAASARGIGAGEWETTVPPVGSGEVADLAADLEQMRRKLIELDAKRRDGERLATVGTFTATIAHEIRNPLSAIGLSVQVLSRKLEDYPQAKGTIDLIADEITLLDSTVDQLLGFSRGMTVEMVVCSVHDVVDEVVRLLGRQARHADVELARRGEATLNADPRRLRQMLINLVLNAIQAQQDTGGSVTVVVTTDGLEVRDHGPGVPEDIREHMFSPFISEKKGGTGLGLHLARCVAEAHGAQLSYRREDSESVFVLTGLA